MMLIGRSSQHRLGVPQFAQYREHRKVPSRVFPQSIYMALIGDDIWRQCFMGNARMRAEDMRPACSRSVCLIISLEI